VLSKKKIDRINVLALKSKEDGLTPQEELEQQKLRTQYLQSVRQSFKSNLMNMKVVDPEGKDVTPSKLKREQNKNRKQ
jgi:uncharacterized protein YnzC (UPF0291/DUF896 family)